MDTLLPSLAYLAGAAAAHAVALAVGAALWPIARRGAAAGDPSAGMGDGCAPQPWSLQLAARWLIGIGAIGTLVLVAGLFGAISLLLVGPLVALAACAGVARHAPLASAAWRRARSRNAPAPSPCPDQTVLPGRRHRLLLGLTSPLFVLLAIHLLVGGLAPDTGQDSMWYHLMLPQQWVLRGDAVMFPHVMPSCYTVLIESTNAALLLVGDELLVTSFHAMALVVALLLIVVAGAAIAGRLGGWAAATVLLPLYALQVGIAPITSKHDIVVALMLAVGLWVPLAALLAGRLPSRAEAAACGVLSGFAVAGKISVALFWFPLFASVAVGVALRGRSLRRAVGFVLLVGATSFAVYAPWLVRAWLYTGNPLFQVAPRALPFRPEFLPVVEALEYQVRLYPLSIAGLLGAAGDLPTKIMRAAAEMFPLYFIVPLGAVGWLARRGDPTRWFGAALLVNFAVVAMLQGSIETVRYGSIFFLAALPATAWALSRVFARLSPRMLPVVLAACLVVGLFTYTQRQRRWADFHTINWSYAPIVGEEEQLAWLARSELGGAIPAFEAVQRAIPADAGVLVVDHPGPYYLRRRAWWCDYICRRWIDEMWTELSADGIAQELERRGLSHVLVLEPGARDWAPIRRAAAAGRLRRVDLPAAAPSLAVELYVVTAPPAQ